MLEEQVLLMDVFSHRPGDARQLMCEGSPGWLKAIRDWSAVGAFSVVRGLLAIVSAETI